MNMQIVIDITEKDYEKIRETSFVENIEIVFKQSSEDRKSTMMLFRVIDAIKNGTLLPKGHGDLIDVDSLDIPVDICDGFEAKETDVENVKKNVKKYLFEIKE